MADLDVFVVVVERRRVETHAAVPKIGLEPDLVRIQDFRIVGGVGRYTRVEPATLEPAVVGNIAQHLSGESMVHGHAPCRPGKCLAFVNRGGQRVYGRAAKERYCWCKLRKLAGSEMPMLRGVTHAESKVIRIGECECRLAITRPGVRCLITVNRKLVERLKKGRSRRDGEIEERPPEDDGAGVGFTVSVY